MNRQEVENYILKKYKAKPEHLWMKTPRDEIFRHSDNKKWFALIMTVRKDRLGLEGTQAVDILNLKCDSALISGLCASDGFLPAYHMNKDKWITVLLDGTADDDNIKTLIQMSYSLTSVKKISKK